MSVQTTSVLRRICETNLASASLRGGAGAGPCCWTTCPPPPPLPISPRRVSGLTPKIQPATSATTTPPRPMPRPPKPPPPPLMPRTSSTLLLSSWPSIRIVVSRRGAERARPPSGLRQRHALLPMVLAAAVLVARLADLVPLEEDDLGAPLA